MTSPLSLYLHIPFCQTKCTYCAFNAYANLDTLIEPFVQALVKEIEIVGSCIPQQVLGTVYLGGGTPSLLTPRQSERILAAIHRRFVVPFGVEITLEANPNDLDFAYLSDLHSLGVNRLSIGMQSANGSELALFARRHDHDAVVRAVTFARRAGFDNLSLDLIYGFPLQTMESWKASFQQLLALQPDHTSLYALGLEEGTPMAEWVSIGRLPAPDDDLAADMYDMATELLDRAGYEQYEISNWSKRGFESRHNLQYWRNLPYAGLGPGAHGYAAGVRYRTVLSPRKYIALLETANGSFEFPYSPATDEAVIVDREGEMAETLIMSLRLTREGVQRSAFAARFGVDLVDLYGPIIDRYVQQELLYVDERVVRLTQRGRLLSNVVFREFV